MTRASRVGTLKHPLFTCVINLCGPFVHTFVYGRFNKRERFKDVFMGFKMWDMVTNFGFRTLPDGRCEVYHRGEYFHGNIPPVSLAVIIVFQIHARWLAWATEHHINHHAFTAETDEDEEIEELSR